MDPKKNLKSKFYVFFNGKIDKETIDAVLASCNYDEEKTHQNLVEMGADILMPSPHKKQRQQSPPSPPPDLLLSTGSSVCFAVGGNLETDCHSMDDGQKQQQQQSVSVFEDECAHFSGNDVGLIQSYPPAPRPSGPMETEDNTETFADQVLFSSKPAPQPVARPASPIDYNAKNIFLMRGLPGSGKTYKAMQLTNDNTNGVILATDDFFMQEGVYVFDKEKLRDAHKWNQNRAENEMKNGTTPICIDNTNIRKSEMKSYVRLADQYNYKVNLSEPWKDTHWKHEPKKCLEKTSKPLEMKVIKKMRKFYEKDVSIDDIRNCEDKFN